MVTAVNGSRLNINTIAGAVVGARANVNANQGINVMSRLNVIGNPRSVLNASRLSVRAVQAAANASVIRAFTKTGRKLFARNTVTDVVTELGFLEEGQTTLTDVPLSDGSYEIEVQTSNDWWQDARSKERFSVQITSGVIEFQSLPAIENLTAVITKGFSTKLQWNIANVSFPSDMQFGLWSSASSPVDVSGVPDATTNSFAGVGVYQFIRTQTVDTFYAVAAFDSVDQAVASEVFSAWDLTLPNAPPDQFAS